MIEHFNGSKWTMASGLGSDATMNGISCTSKEFCMAVGGSDSGSTVSYVFRGRDWRQVPIPNAAFFSSNWNQLYSVSCTASTYCVAVGTDIGGQTRGGTFNQQVLEVFDGSSWTLKSVSDNWHGALTAVSCKGTWCIATGAGQALPGPPSDPVAGRFFNAAFIGRAGKWTKVQDPPTVVGDIACPVLRVCDGVPDFTHGFGLAPSTVSQYRNFQWSSAVVPDGANEGTNGTEINGISCLSERRCVIVGAGELRSATVPAVPGRTLRPVIEDNQHGKWGSWPAQQLLATTRI